MKFEPENRKNFQTGTPDYDEVGFNSKTFDFYKKIIQIRRSNPVLSHGEMEFLFAQGKTLVYKRFDATTEIIVAFNLSDSTFSYKLPTDGTYTDLLTGKGFPSTIELEPLSGHILSLQTK
jgi:glycosidase